MTGIKGFSEMVGIFRTVQHLALQGGFCRLDPQKPSRLPLHSHKTHAKKISASSWHLKLSHFQISFLIIFIILLVFICPNPVFSANEKSLAEEDEIFEMDISQLMQMEVTVTSVSKRPEPLHKAASAIYVLTEEDIRRSGAVNIMEALRMVPGVLVSKLNQNRYAISIRGFNQRLGSDKLLVLMDGRSIYSPTDSGVFWIGQDTVFGRYRAD